ncbi:hypothetical protein BUZ93_11475 [Mammaliicoccus sciuri]|nr:hypothetical protein BUZ93_11475 [Mammaliicoccus sciuri]
MFVGKTSYDSMTSFYIKFKRKFNKEPKVNKIPKANIKILKILLPSQINMIMLISISVMPHIKYIVPTSDLTD